MTMTAQSLGRSSKTTLLMATTTIVMVQMTTTMKMWKQRGDQR